MRSRVDVEVPIDASASDRIGAPVQYGIPRYALRSLRSLRALCAGIALRSLCPCGSLCALWPDERRARWPCASGFRSVDEISCCVDVEISVDAESGCGSASAVEHGIAVNSRIALCACGSRIALRPLRSRRTRHRRGRAHVSLIALRPRWSHRTLRTGHCRCRAGSSLDALRPRRPNVSLVALRSLDAGRALRPRRSCRSLRAGNC